MRKSPLPWFPLHVDLPDHAKSLRLNATLGEHNSHVYPLNLWCWAAQHAPDGTLKASTVQTLIRMVEDACRWRGEAGHLFRALVEVRFLDPTSKPVRSVHIHNWELICGAHLRAAERQAERSRNRRAAQKRAEMEAALAAQDDAAGGPDLVPFSKTTSEAPPPKLSPVNGQVAEKRGGKSERARTVRAPSGGRPVSRSRLRGDIELPSAGGRCVGASASPYQPPPVVVVDQQKNFSLSPTTTTNGHSGDFEGGHVDAFGFIVRNVDIAGDLLSRAVERLSYQQRYGLNVWALSLKDDVLELGAEGQGELERAVEYYELNLLEAIRAELPGVSLKWTVVPPPPPRPLPSKWTLEQCVRWMNANGLRGGASDKALRAFWKDAQHVRPAMLINAVKLFRSDRDFEERDWPLAVFVTDGVWKRRVPPADLPR